VECVVDQMNLLLAVAVPNLAETNSDLILSSGGHNFAVLCILSSGDMSYELDATLILDLCAHESP